MVCKSFMERIREADKDVAVVDEKKQRCRREVACKVNDKARR